MNQIENLAQLYAYLDENCLNHKYSDQKFGLDGIAFVCEKFYSEARKQLKSQVFKSQPSGKSLIQNDIEKGEWEALFFSFNIYHNDFHHSSFTYEGDKLVPSYDPNKLTEHHLIYLKTRLNSAKHPLMKSRYAHILYLKLKEPKKNSFGKTALENYFKALHLLELENLNISKNEVEEQHGIFNLFEHIIINTFLLSIELSLKKETVRDYFLEILIEDKCADPSELLYFMVQNRVQFKRIHFTNLQELCKELGSECLEYMDSIALDYFSLGKDIVAIYGDEIYDWNKVIVFAKEYLADEIVVSDTVSKAIEQFKNE